MLWTSVHLHALGWSIKASASSLQRFSMDGPVNLLHRFSDTVNARTHARLLALLIGDLAIEVPTHVKVIASEIFGELVLSNRPQKREFGTVSSPRWGESVECFSKNMTKLGSQSL
jgi:hypothetical protein